MYVSALYRYEGLYLMVFRPQVSRITFHILGGRSSGHSRRQHRR